MPLEPEFSSAFSRALNASIGSSVKSTLMPVAFSNAGATSSTRHQCHGPLSPTNTSLSGLFCASANFGSAAAATEVCNR